MADMDDFVDIIDITEVNNLCTENFMEKHCGTAG
jgi:hypothetical protein